MKKVIFFFIFSALIIIPAVCIRIDGKIWDWENSGKEFKCKQRILSKDRSGLDMDTIKISLDKKYLYLLIEGRSVTGQKQDAGGGFKRTSVRVSFSSAQSPLNRFRVLAHPGDPWRIKESSPYANSLKLGSKKDKFWVFGKSGKKCYIEMKVPVFQTSKGIHVGSTSGPLLKLSETSSARKRISDVLINTVDIRTHRLVDTMSFPINKGDL